MMSDMKRRNFAVILAMVLTFSFCIPFAAFAEEEKSENTVATDTTVEAVITEGTTEEPSDAPETADEVSADAEETADPLTLIAENGTETAEEKTAGDESEEPEEEDLVEELVKVREELAKLEENEEFDIKAVYSEYLELETDEEKEEYVAALAEEESGLFAEYLAVKEKEQEILTKVAALAVTDPEAAQVIELEADRKFAEEELKAMEAEIEALGLEEITEETSEETDQAVEEQITEEEVTEEQVVEEAEVTADAEKTDNAEVLPETEAPDTAEEAVDPENAENVEITVTEEAAAEVIEGSNGDESAETAEDAEKTEDPATAEETSSEENAEPESKENAENADNAEESEDTEDVENAEGSEDTEDAENAENAEGSEDTEDAENAEGSEDAEETESEENLPGESAVETETVPEKKIDLWYEYDGELEYGKEILINSDITGYGDNISLQWYYSTDGINYEPIEGAVAPTYLFVLDETNCWYYWDLIATEQ